jgi:cytochrome b pre-mRNA-processing protein 3
MTLLHRLAKAFAAPASDPAIAALYGACVAQARLPEFYRDLKVPDTIDGRFDLLVLHVALVIRRLGDAAEARQKLFDLMFADMDRSLREMGVGDMGIGRRIKAMISAFYGRAQAYAKALEEGDDALAASLARNLYGNAPPPSEVLQAMTGYVRRVVAKLDVQATEKIAEGQVVFSSPLEGENSFS